MPSALAIIVILSAASITICAPGVGAQAQAQRQVYWALPGAGDAEERGMCHMLLMADRTDGFSRFREDLLTYMRFASAGHTFMSHDAAFITPKYGFTACLEWIVDESMRQYALRTFFLCI